MVDPGIFSGGGGGGGGGKSIDVTELTLFYFVETKRDESLDSLHLRNEAWLCKISTADIGATSNNVV